MYKVKKDGLRKIERMGRRGWRGKGEETRGG